MAVTAVTITSGPTVVGRSVTLSGTLSRDGGGTNNNLNFLSYTVGYGSLGTITRLSDNSTIYNAAGTAGTDIAWTWTGTLPEGNYLAVTVNLNEDPYTLLATSASNVGLVQLRKPLNGIWTPRRDARGLFVPNNPAYPSKAGGSTGRPLRGFFYPTPDGVYRSVTDSTSKLGQYGGIARGVPTQWGLGIDAPNNWEWSGLTPQSFAPGSGSHVLVSVFSLHDASKRVTLYPAVLGESRTSATVDSGSYVFWRNPNGEQSLLVNISTQFGGTPFSINGLSNGLHCLVIAVTLGSGASGLRAYLNGALVAVSSAPTYFGILSVRPYYYWGSISQSHLNVGNVLLNAELGNVNLSESAAANLSLNPYRYFFQDAPKTSPKQRLFSGVLSLPDPPTEFTSIKGGKLLPQPWRQQPTYRAQLNTANPLTQGIIHAGTPHHDVFDAVGSLSWKNSARPPIGTGRSGLFWASFPYSQYSISSPNNYENRDQTALWIVSYEYDSYTGTFPQIKGPSGGDNSGSGIGVRSDGNIVYFGGFQATLIDTGVKIPLRATSIIVVTSNTANGTNIYLNGNKIGFSATRYSFDDGYYSSLNRLGYVEAYGNYITVQGRQAYPVYTYGVAQWITALSETQVKQLSENPWQIFKPNPGRVYFLPAKDTSFKGGRFLPQRWKNQPQGNVTIDWNNPLTSELFLAAAPGISQQSFYRNPSNNSNFISSDVGSVLRYQSTVRRPTTVGVGFSGTAVYVNSSNVSANYLLKDISLGGSPVYTYGFVYCQMATPDAQVSGFSYNNNQSTFSYQATNTSAQFIARNWTSQIDTTANDHFITAPSGVPSQKQLTATVTWVTGQPGRMYNGKNLLVSSNQTVWDGGYELYGNMFLTAYGAGKTAGLLGVTWLRALTDNDRAAFDENPWQIFKPNPGRIYFLPGSTKRGKFLFLFN
jgi:hypothetical protein